MNRTTSRRHFALGAGLAVVLLAGLAEGYLRRFPPRDLYPFLGETSPLSGAFVPDPDFAVAYRSWEAFRADNAERLAEFWPWPAHADGRPLWAFFGNSFVQAPGMLADTARAAVCDHRVFNLGRNEPVPVRFAQIKTLLANGLRPERIFVEFMPVDVLSLGPQPLSTLQVTSKGALTYKPRLPPGPAGWLVAHNRLALTAWVRTGRQQGNPHFDKGTVYRGIEEPLRGDLDRLFAGLARVAHAHGVPVTVILIPAYHQITRGAGFGFQDTLAAMLRRHGLDVFDPRDAFGRYPEPGALFLPDKHFNALGNQILLVELLKHLQTVSNQYPAGENPEQPATGYRLLATAEKP